LGENPRTKIITDFIYALLLCQRVTKSFLKGLKWPSTGFSDRTVCPRSWALSRRIATRKRTTALVRVSTKLALRVL